MKVPLVGQFGCPSTLNLLKIKGPPLTAIHRVWRGIVLNDRIPTSVFMNTISSAFTIENFKLEVRPYRPFCKLRKGISATTIFYGKVYFQRSGLYFLNNTI